MILMVASRAFTSNSTACMSSKATSARIQADYLFMPTGRKNCITTTSATGLKSRMYAKKISNCSSPSSRVPCPAKPAPVMWVSSTLNAAIRVGNSLKGSFFLWIDLLFNSKLKVQNHAKWDPAYAGFQIGGVCRISNYDWVWFDELTMTNATDNTTKR